MAFYTSGNDEWQRQQRLRGKGSYFPNIYGSGAGNAGFGPGQGLLPPDQNPAYQAAVAKGGTYASRRDDFRNKYPQFANPTAQKNLQNFDLTQAYQQGYGAPPSTTQQGPGGPYRVAGEVAAPYIPPNAFQNLASNLGAGFGAIGQMANNVGQFGANAFAGFKNTFFPAVQNMAQSGNQPQNQALQNVQNFQQTGSFMPQQQFAQNQPRRYFDPGNNYGF